MPPDEAILAYVARRFDRQNALIRRRFDRLEKHMSDVAGIEGQALADLNTAVTNLGAALANNPLAQQLTDAQAQIVVLQNTDAADVAARDAALAQVQTLLTQAQTAAGTIEASVAQIVAATPAPPVA